jgi:hypothetical protein
VTKGAPEEGRLVGLGVGQLTGRAVGAFDGIKFTILTNVTEVFSRPFAPLVPAPCDSARAYEPALMLPLSSLDKPSNVRHGALVETM